MIDKASLEQFLRINGVTPTASDEEIKSVLLSARWHDDDVDTAMLVLRENTTTHESHVDSLHKVFRSDERLEPDSVSYLLGIGMDASTVARVGSGGRRAQPHRTFIFVLAISIFTFCLAMAFVAGGMWVLEVGPFHQSKMSL